MGRIKFAGFVVKYTVTIYRHRTIRILLATVAAALFVAGRTEVMDFIIAVTSVHEAEEFLRKL
jgi:hypothetical protein